MQTIVIAGRLGRDAEVRPVNSGDKVCNFTVAVDVRNGSEKSTNWWRVSLWGKRGEALAQYLTKGSSVTVSGEFSLTEYEGKPQLNIRANEITLQGSKSDSSGSQQRDEPRQQSQQRQPSSFESDLDDDVPF